MAKRKKTTKKKGKVDGFFQQLIGEQNTVSPGAAVTGDEMFSKVKMWLPTGSRTLDTIISNQEKGGWPIGRIIEVYGPEAIGKSTLAFQAMAECQKLGGIPIYFDIEQAGAENVMKACGIDMERIIISRLTEMEDIFEALEKNLTSISENPQYKGAPVFVCMDSLAQMSIKVETEGDYEHNMNMSLRKAQQMGKALRKIVPFLNKANACLLIVNQTREKPGVMFGDPTTTPGGNALKFAASIRIYLKNPRQVVLLDPAVQAQYDQAIEEYHAAVDKWKKDGKNSAKPEKPKKGDFKGDQVIVGYDVAAFTEKNKVAPPKRTAKFRIMFGDGIVEEHAWLDYAEKFGILNKAGSGRYRFADKDRDKQIGVFTKKEWMEIISDVEIHDSIRDIIINKLIRPLDSGTPVEENEQTKQEEDE